MNEAAEYRVVRGEHQGDPVTDREEAVRAARAALEGKRPGAEAVVQRRQGGTWGTWRRFTVHADGAVVRLR